MTNSNGQLHASIKCSPNQSMISQHKFLGEEGHHVNTVADRYDDKFTQRVDKVHKCTSTRFTNIATGETSPAITPSHLFGYSNFSNFYHSINFQTFKDRIYKHLKFNLTLRVCHNCVDIICWHLSK